MAMRIGGWVLAMAALLGMAQPARAADAGASGQAVEGLKKYLETGIAQRAAIDKESFASVPLTKDDAAAAQKLLWDDHVKQIKATRADEMKARKIVEGKVEMPFYYKIFGEKPKNGRSLFISMHGGGGAPKALNDSQWENQKHLYKPKEGVYLAPRAPTNTWNLWHEAHIDTMFDRLIEDLIVFEDVDPNRVYLMGYSAGGDGVYQLAPRMADRWAAASMMAGHPNDARPDSLRDLPFAIHVGALDSAYNRNKVAAQWGKMLDDLHKADPDGYIHVAKLHAGRAHWMNLEDAEAVPWMAQYTRNPIPKKVVWRQSPRTHARFYWLAVPADLAKGGTEIIATYGDQKADVESKDVAKVIVRLNDQMMDLDKPVAITSGGKEAYQGTVSRTIGTIAKTLAERGDPKSVFDAQVEINVEK